MAQSAPIGAEAMAAAALHDPQFAVPHRPRRRRGLVIQRRDDSLVVEGTPKRQLLRGRAATELVPGLLALLDGDRDHAGLATEIGVAESVVFKTLALLWTCGIIEEAAPDGVDVSDVPGHRADYLSRIGDSTGANPAWEQAITRLADARIEVFGTGALADAVRDELGASITTVAGSGSTPAAGTTLVVAADPENGALVSYCWSAGVPLLRVRLRGRRAELGPYVDRSFTPCLDCLTSENEPDPPVTGDAPVPADAGLAAALLAGDVFAMIGRASPSPLPAQWRSVDLATLSQQRRSAATRPGCSNCSVRVEPRPRPASLATRYEAAISFPPHRYIDVKAHQAHYKPSNLALQRGEKHWPIAPRVPLPAPALDRLAAVSADRTAPTDLDTLALLLTVTAGWRDVTGERVNRWTASGGNIGSVVAHLVVRDAPGLDPGIYGYVASDHELALLRRDPARIPATGADSSDGPPVTIVYTGHFTRVAKKYGPFGLRVVLLDAGCAVATLRESCAVLGVACRPRYRWDDRGVADALGIDPEVEPVTSLVDLGSRS